MGKENRENTISEPKRIGQEITKFFKDSAFGDAKYQAFFNWSTKQELYDDLSSYKKGTPDNIKNHSELRIAENKLALIDHTIQEKTTTTPGYYEAYLEINHLFSALYKAYSEDNQYKFFGDNQVDFPKHLVGEFKNLIKEDLLERSAT